MRKKQCQPKQFIPNDFCLYIICLFTQFLNKSHYLLYICTGQSENNEISRFCFKIMSCLSLICFFAYSLRKPQLAIPQQGLELRSNKIRISESVSAFFLSLLPYNMYFKLCLHISLPNPLFDHTLSMDINIKLNFA